MSKLDPKAFGLAFGILWGVSLIFMGITAMVMPLKVGGNIVQFDMWIMLATSVGVMYLAHFGKTIRFASGLAMTLVYCGYIGLTLSV